jgi:hypothetical protein
MFVIPFLYEDAYKNPTACGTSPCKGEVWRGYKNIDITIN